MKQITETERKPLFLMSYEATDRSKSFSKTPVS